MPSIHRASIGLGSRFEVVPGHQNVYFHDVAYQPPAQLESVAKSTRHSQAHLALEFDDAALLSELMA
jgi:hypothetical protein